MLVHWLRANKISLNAKMTEIILFKSKDKNIYKNLNFRLSGQKLKPTNKIKYLGITIDENLNWNELISQLTKKLSRATGIIGKMRHLVDYKTLLSIQGDRKKMYRKKTFRL